MNEYQRQRIGQQQAKVNRVKSLAHETGKKKDEVNAGWAMNTLDQMEQEAGDH